jgi:hypothetical protein
MKKNVLEFPTVTPLKQPRVIQVFEEDAKHYLTILDGHGSNVETVELPVYAAVAIKSAFLRDLFRR